MSHPVNIGAVALAQQQAQPTQAQLIIDLEARLAAEHHLRTHFQQKVLNQRRQLRQLQALYNAYLIGAKSGTGLARLNKAVADYNEHVAKIAPAASGEVPAPTVGLMEQGRKLEASA